MSSQLSGQVAAFKAGEKEHRAQEDGSAGHNETMMQAYPKA